MERKYRHLTIDERERMAVLRGQGKSAREIAKLIRRNHSTVSRELKRYPSKRYSAHKAQLLARKKKEEAGRRERLKSELIRDYVLRKLKLGWSPEQIAGRLKFENHKLSVSHEAIYQYIYEDAKELIIYLTRRRGRRFPKQVYRKHRKLRIPERKSILMRPETVNRREEFGHWEADSLVSRRSKAACHVLCERKSRYAKLTKLLSNTALSVREAIIHRLYYEPKRSRLSLTYDNGSENVEHQRVNEALRTQSFFCEPYHSWEKGTVENTNGLVRRFIPKKTDFSRIPTSDISRIENLLNARPRKCLQYKTPKEVYSELSGALPG